LDKLNISRRVIDAARPRHKRDTIEYRRKKIIANIEEQIELANLSLQGNRCRSNGSVDAMLSPYGQGFGGPSSPTGTYSRRLRYNKIPLNILGRETSIEVGHLKRLTSVYKTVIRAIGAGEIDNSTESAAKKSRS